MTWETLLVGTNLFISLFGMTYTCHPEACRRSGFLVVLGMTAFRRRYSRNDGEDLFRMTEKGFALNDIKCRNNVKPSPVFFVAPKHSPTVTTSEREGPITMFGMTRKRYGRQESVMEDDKALGMTEKLRAQK